jgi:hypothetical protein
MYEAPTLSDFQRNLDTLIHSGMMEGFTAHMTTRSEFMSRGVGHGVQVVAMVAARLEEVYTSVLDRAMTMIDEFVRRNSELSPAELARTTRPRFEELATTLLGMIPADVPEEQQETRVLYSGTFRRRLDGALRDIEIGFIGGRNVVTKGPIVLNNIKIDNSVVGAINTGEVKTIDVNLTNLRNAGREDASAALKALTEAIISEASIDVALKNDLVEQVAFLTEQAAKRPEDRKPGLIKAAMGALTQVAGTVTAISGAWQAAEPIVRSIFSF